MKIIAHVTLIAMYIYMYIYIRIECTYIRVSKSNERSRIGIPIIIWFVGLATGEV